mgnify:CR=1 FL=1
MSNDQWVALKEVSQRRKNAGHKADAVGSKKYKSMLRVLIRIVRKHIVFDSKKYSQNIANTFIERYMIKCNVNGSVVFVSMSDGVILFLSRVSPAIRQSQSSRGPCRARGTALRTTPVRVSGVP